MTGIVVLGVLPVVLGMAVGWLAAGRFRAIVECRLRALWLLWLAAAVQIVQLIADLPLLAVVFGLVLVWLLVNVGNGSAGMRLGFGGIALGWAANGLAILANGGRMPYSPTAAAVVGLPLDGATPKNVPAGSDVRLEWLADVVPVQPISAVLSLGDLFIMIGVGTLVAAAMLRPVRRQVPAIVEEVS